MIKRSGWVEGAQSGHSYPLPSVGVLLFGTDANIAFGYLINSVKGMLRKHLHCQTNEVLRELLIPYLLLQARLVLPPQDSLSISNMLLLQHV